MSVVSYRLLLASVACLAPGLLAAEPSPSNRWDRVERFEYATVEEGKPERIVEQVAVVFRFATNEHQTAYSSTSDTRTETVLIRLRPDGSVVSGERQQSTPDGANVAAARIWLEEGRIVSEVTRDGKSPRLRSSARDGQPVAVEPSLMNVLRAFPFDSGEERRIQMATFAQFVVPMAIRQLPDETVTVPAGSFDCRKLEAVVSILGLKIRTTYWLTKAPPHAMVRYRGRRGLFLAPVYVTELTGGGAVTASEAGLARSWPEGGPRVLWTRPVPRGLGAPSIRDGRVYVLSHDAEAWRDTVECLDLRTGTNVWTYGYYAYGGVQYDGAGQPAVTTNRVYTLGPFGDLHAIDRERATRVWSLNVLVKPRDPGDINAVPPPGQFKEDTLGLGAQPHPKWGFTQTPLLYRDTVIVAPRSPVTAVAAFDRETGAVRWKSPPAGGGMFAHQTPMLATNLAGRDQVVLLSNVHLGPRARIDGFDAADGRRLWTQEIEKYNIPIPSPVQVDSNRLFVSGGYTVGCFMLRIEPGTNGMQAARLFENKNCTALLHTPVLHQGHLYANSYDEFHNEKSGIANRGLICMDLEGRIAWETGASHHFDHGPLLLADGLLFVLHGQRGSLHLVEATNEGFRELAQTQVFPEAETTMRDRIWTPMALADRRLVLRHGGELKCLWVGEPGEAP